MNHNYLKYFVILITLSAASLAACQKEEVPVPQEKAVAPVKAVAPAGGSPLEAEPELCSDGSVCPIGN